MPTLKIGTRGSRLALAQTGQIIDICSRKTDIRFETVVIHTRGDQQQDTPLSDGSSVGVFTRAVEEQLIDRSIDVAVHSLKDLPLDQPPGLSIAGTPLRADAGEILLIHPDFYDDSARKIPVVERAIVGTASPRRAAQLLAIRSDLEIKLLRGNLQTRLRKIEERLYNAAVFAAAGLERLALNPFPLIVHRLDADYFVPAPGQGAIAVEMRSENPHIQVVRRAVNDPQTELCVDAERRLLRRFGGGCSLAIGALATRLSEHYYLRGFNGEVSSPRWASLKTTDLQLGIVELHSALNKSEPEEHAEA